VSLAVETFEQKKEWTIDSVSASRREVRPAAVRLRVSLAGDNGAEVARTVDYQVPAGAQAGPLYFTVSDAATANLNDFRAAITANPRNPGQLISTANNLHANNKAYVRVWPAMRRFNWRAPICPLRPLRWRWCWRARNRTSPASPRLRNSKIASMEIDAGDMVISGVKPFKWK